MTTGLLLHVGRAVVQRAAVFKVKTPVATRTWHPIAHGALVQLTLKAFTDSSYTVTAEAHALWRSGARYFGVFQVAPVAPSVPLPTDYGLIVGIQNSHDQGSAARFYLGSYVYICENVAFSGEVLLARRHTFWVAEDLDQFVPKAIGQIITLQAFQTQRIQKYKETSLTEAQANTLLIQSLERGVIGPLRLPPILKAWRALAPRSAWSLFNAFTLNLKGTLLPSLITRTIVLHDLFDRIISL